ncbi:MAG: hypothetical protein EBS84_03320 [Proteobacteria bacterium]|nr:hypothetical protein [Pseudomonadota bacterium]
MGFAGPGIVTALEFRAGAAALTARGVVTPDFLSARVFAAGVALPAIATGFLVGAELTARRARAVGGRGTIFTGAFLGWADGWLQQERETTRGSE